MVDYAHLRFLDLHTDLHTYLLQQAAVPAPRQCSWGRGAPLVYARAGWAYVPLLPQCPVQEGSHRQPPTLQYCRDLNEQLLCCFKLCRLSSLCLFLIHMYGSSSKIQLYLVAIISYYI